MENSRFTFGSYPSKEELMQLKEEGYETIITLLHPAVTPFEPVLLKEEEKLCKEAGIKLLSIPMLPWISENEEAIEKIKQIALKPTGKYYVHCYLGKDRVNVVKRLITSFSENKQVKFNDKENARSLDNLKMMERGPVSKLGIGIYYSPYPTDEEYMGYVIAAGVQQVISLMDLLMLNKNYVLKKKGNY